jgi:adenine/guanine phosphoribosyltransferase-like PRPP-binding protein
MPSASEEQGPRHPAELYPHLCVTGRLIIRPGHQYVLVDDVLTSGGHLRAAAAFLRASGADPVLAVCGARADSVAQADPFQRRIDELEDFEP